MRQDGPLPPSPPAAASADADEATIRSVALASPKVQKHLAGREPRKLIVVPGRLVNIVG